MKVMVIVGMLSWWYTGGLSSTIQTVWRRLVSTFDYFSIDLLIKTLFAPYRQISAGSVDGPIGLQLRALVDQLLSRLIGATMRTIVMFIGTIALLIVVLISLVQVVLWLIVPLLPIVGLVLMLTGWVPWTI